MCAAESESVRVTHRFAASPERIFNAWTNAKLLARWLAPIADADPRAGGRFRLQVSRDGDTHVVTGEYLEFVPARLLAMTWIYEGPMAPNQKVNTRVVVDFRKNGSGAEVSVRHEGLSHPVYRDAIRSGAWTKALEALDALVTDSAS